MKDAGTKLKKARQRIGVSLRDVEELSQELADKENKPEFFVSKAWLTRLENGHPTSNVHKLLSLSLIYRLRATDVLKLYGADMDRINDYQLSMGLPATHLMTLAIYDQERAISFPLCFDPALNLDTTNLLSRMIEVWGEVPISLLQRLKLRHSLYGFIGLHDHMMYPLLGPGSFVQINDKDRKVEIARWRNEYERPIYFVELHDGYACCWCELDGKQLSLVSHPLSPVRSRHVLYPQEAEIVGRVTAVAMRLVTGAEHIQPGRRGMAARSSG